MICQVGSAQFTIGTVGVGGRNLLSDVKTLQRLLLAAGIKVKGGADGGWGDGTAIALAKFVDDWDDATGAEFGIPPASSDPVKVLQPDDEWLLRMAAQAEILIPMPKPKTGMAAVLQLHGWFQDKGLLYESKNDYKGPNSRSFWALPAQPNFAVQLQLLAGMINRGPIKINCTTYANMMLSVFRYGTLANPCYNASVQNIGGGSSEHLSKARYHFQQVMRDEKSPDGKQKPLNYFATAEQIDDATDDAKLYSMEIGSDVHRGVGHHAILHNGTVYQSHDTDPSAEDCSLEKFMASTTPCIYLFEQ
jgi:hypothetical protein